MVDENPYEMPKVDESKWFSGGHLGGHLQKLNCQVGCHLHATLSFPCVDQQILGGGCESLNSYGWRKEVVISSQNDHL